MNVTPSKCFRKMTQNRSQETKNAIVSAGIRLFAEEGLHKINTKDIARAAGISVGSFYGYYEDKKHLFIDIVHIYKEDLLSVTDCSKYVQKPLESCSSEDVIDFFVNGKLQVAEKYPLAFHLELNHMRFRDPDVEAVFNHYYELEIDNYLKSLSLPGGEVYLRVTDLRLAARIIYDISDNMVSAYLSTETAEAKNALIKEYKQMVQRYLFNR